MKKIYAPWRHGYVTQTANQPNKERLKNNCVFCDQFANNNDEKSLTLKKFFHSAVIMNRYPYNGGHLMVLPLEHKKELKDLSVEVRTEIMETLNKSIIILEKIINPHGFNIGINMGSAGGGGIPSHLHIHIVPRWEGDTNFCTTIAECKPISIDLSKTYKDLKVEFDKLT